MPITIEIDGLGDVEVDASFSSLSPARQQQVIDQIHAQATAQATAQTTAPKDIPRIKRNLQKMVDQGAPEEDMDAYIAEEGVTAEELRAHRDSGKSSQGRSVPQATQPSIAPAKDARSIVQGLFPGAHITDWKRDPESPLGRANPSSWHNRSGGAVDIRPIEGMTFQDAKAKLEAEGYPIIQALDEVENPSPHATGPHWHFVIGDRPADWGGTASEDPEKPFRQEITRGQAKQALRQFNREQFPQRKAKTTAENASVLGFGDSAAFGFLDELGAGADAILGGGRKTIWDGSSFSDAYDANVKANRELLDAASDEHPVAYGAGAVAGGLVPIGGGLGVVKAGGALKKAAGAAGAGAMFGALYGAGSDEGNPIERLDGAAEGAAIGAAGGIAAHGAITAGAKVLNPAIERLMPGLAQARFAARHADNPFVVTDAQIADDLDRILSGITAKKKLSKTQTETLVNRLNTLESSYLPDEQLKALDLEPSVKARLKLAMANRHILSEEDVAALRDGTPAGDAVAEGIEKARRLRTYVTDASGSNEGAASLFAQAFGSAMGSKVAGPLGGAIGGQVGRNLAPSASKQLAKDALGLAKDAPRFAKLPGVIAARKAGLPTPRAELQRLADETMDAPFEAARIEREQAARLAEDAKRTHIANAMDNVTPWGGMRGLIYERTGLLPVEQDVGALKALQDGAISEEQFEAFLENPKALMDHNAGNALIDRMAAMIEKGELVRDHKWKPQINPSRTAVPVVRPGLWSSLSDVPQSVQDAATSEFLKQNPGAQASLRVGPEGLIVTESGGPEIRNPVAYAATARANQRRVSSALDSVQSDIFISDPVREVISSAITRIGNTSSRDQANDIATDALDRLEREDHDFARSVLLPLVEQIKHKD